MAQQDNTDGPKLKAKEIIKHISEESGIGQRTVSVNLSEYRNKGIHHLTKPKFDQRLRKKLMILTKMPSGKKFTSFDTGEKFQR